MRNISIFYAFILLTIPAIIFGAEPVAQVAAEQPAWVGIVVTVLGTLITAVLVPYLKKLQGKVEAEKVEAQHGAKSLLIGRVKSFLLDQAIVIAERDFPVIVRKVAAGEIKTAEDARKLLYALGGELRGDLIEFFNNEGIDIVATLGDKYIDQLIRWAADKVSPFPGKETATALVSKGADVALEKGLDYVKTKLEKMGD